MNGGYSVDQAMQGIFLDDAEDVARQTGFQRRRSKLGAATFAQTIVGGLLEDPDTTLDELAQTAAHIDTPVTAQAVDQKFTPKAVAFFKELLERQLRRVLRADEPVTSQLLNRFSEVNLQDSTTISLPPEFEAQYRGCGGSTAQSGRAALKFQVRFDQLRGGFEAIRIEQGRECDQSTPLQTEAIRPGSLHLRDLGYFDLDVLQTIDRRGAYFVSRLNDQTRVTAAETDEALDLETWLSGLPASTRALQRRVLVGVQHRLACRLIALRVPPAIAERRRRELRQRAQKKGYTPSARKLALCDWNLYITNAPVELLSIEEVAVLARLRWQVELLFKHWKSDGHLARSRSQKPNRILSEVFAKLIGLILEHWVLLRSCWGDLRLSLRRASKTVRKLVLRLLETLRDPERFAATMALIRRRLEVAARKEKRGKHPASFQLVEDPTIYGSRVSD